MLIYKMRPWTVLKVLLRFTLTETSGVIISCTSLICKYVIYFMKPNAFLRLITVGFSCILERIL